MDLLWVVLGLAVAAAVAFVLFRYRRRIAARVRARQVERARNELDRARKVLQEVDSTLRPLLANGDYVPEYLRRRLEATIQPVAERTIPSITSVAPLEHEAVLRRDLEDALRRAKEVQRVLQEHNLGFVRKAVAEHAKLLVEELRTDDAQREAVVKDDVRNLVIAGAGSGKTRTIVSRVRFLLALRVPPEEILAVTFTNKATEEMQTRLAQMGVPIAVRGTAGVIVSTLHALGKRVVQATLPGPISVADDRWMDSLVARVLAEAREARDPELARLYINAILYFHRNEDERAPAVGGEKTYRTLQGDHVRSIGERIVADFLLTNHVPHKYEARAAWAQVGSDRNAYHPDFKLLEPEVYIEYWGVNRNGQVPGWMGSSEAYRQGIAWKRDQFRREGKVLIEFYDYERSEGTLEKALRERLIAAGVALRPMRLEELGKVVGDMKYIGSAIEKLLVQFLANARAQRLRPEEIQKRLGRTTPRVRHFGLLGIAVLERYEAGLAAEGRIDFSDMLHRAADILEEGLRPLPKFAHILVDEFQDTSAPMARFLKALLAVDNARLFAVGDDWQAIYGFAGGDVDHIVNFEKHFGPASVTMLNVNYRSPRAIVEAGAALIAHNPAQIPKKVVVASAERGDAYVHEVPDDDDELVGATVGLIQQERQRIRPDDILVLSRTNHLLGPIVEACRRNRIPTADPDRDVPGVRILSAHKAKGLEAAVVIVVNASDHLLGFPSKVENPDVLEPVRMSTESESSEERRLFYVAITRAMKRLHLVARKGLPSPYIAEIEGSGAVAKAVDASRVRVGARFQGTFHVERLYPLTERQRAAGIRQAGLLSTSMSRFAFTSWAAHELEEGGAYWLEGLLKERPFRDQHRVKLDERTRADRRFDGAVGGQPGGLRELRPRPPPALQPQVRIR